MKHLLPSLPCGLSHIALLVCLGLIPAPLYSLPLGNDFLRLNPNASGVDFINIESSFTTPYDSVVIGSMVEYSLGVQPVIREPGIEVTPSLDSVLTAHQSLAMGVLPNFELSARFPIVLRSETLDHPSDKGALTAEGFSYLGAGGKYRFLKRGPYELSFAAEFGTDLMKDNPYTGSTVPFMSSLYFASTADYSPLIFGVNVGYKFRTTADPIVNPATGQTPISPVPHALLLGLGLSYQTLTLGSVVVEAYGSHNFPESDTSLTDRLSTSVEVLFAYSYIFRSGLGVKAGTGTEVFRGPGAAQLRIFAGLDYLIEASKLPAISGDSAAKKNQKKPRPKDIPYEEYSGSSGGDEEEEEMPSFDDP